MNNFSSTQICQSLQNTLRNFSQDFFACSAAELLDFPVYTVQAATLAELHGDGYCARGNILEGTVIFANIRGRAFTIEVEFTEDLFSNLGSWVCGDYLSVALTNMPLRFVRDYTFNANTVLPPFRMHFVTAPPAPSPSVPNSIILSVSLTLLHPSIGSSSTSNLS